MKNVLLTTTALVAFAGAAAAADVDLGWSGDAMVEYNFAAPGTFSYGANAALDVTITQDLNNGAVASLALTDFVTWNDVTGIAAAPSWVAMLETSYGSISAGAIDNAGLGFAEVAGMNVDVDGPDTDDTTGTIVLANVAHDLRADTTLGGYAIAASTATGGTDVAMQASGSAGTVDFAVFYETTAMGVNASTTVGGAALSFAYASQGANTSYGVGVGYDVTDTISVSGAYASNNTVSQIGVGAAYDDGSISASLDYDVTAATWDAEAGYTSEIAAGTTVTVGATFNSANVSTGSIDLVHVAGDMSVYAGADTASNTYAGVVYDLGGGANAYGYYSNGTELGPQDWNAGTVVGLSIEF